MKTKNSAPKSGRAIVAVRPSLPSQPKTVVTTVPGVVHPPTLVAPLERALTQFAEELRKELANAREQIQALRSELSALRTQYEAHTHGYTRTLTGSGGNQWFDLRLFKHYIDDEKENFDNWGVYLREGGVSGSAPEVRTGPPSP